MTFTMGLWYWFLLRFTSARQAAMLTGLTAIISHMYSLSFWMHSDALFCLLTTAAMVVACQINERRSHLALRIVVLSALCVAAQLVRWAGVLQMLVIGGILIRGHALPLSRKRLDAFIARASGPGIALVVSCALSAGTFFVVRHALRLTPEQETLAKEAGATFDEQQQPQAPAEARSVDILNGRQSTKTSFAQEMIKRIRESGKWFSWALWPELRFAGGVKLLRSVDTIFGWLMIVPLVVWGIVSLKNREWMWLGVGIYCVYLCLNWPNPNARYLVPLLPLLVWGITEGIRAIFNYYGKMHWGSRIVTVLLLSIAVANTSLLAVDMWVARTGDFYSHYEGGLDASLISCVKYVNNRDIKDGELAVSDVYTNLGKRRQSKFGLRATVMLSDRVVKSMPGKWDTEDVNRAKFISWARSRHIKFALFQLPISPWRVWHFRLPAGLQEYLSKEPVPPPSAGWVLYRYVAPVNAVMPLPTPHVVTLSPAKWVKVEILPVHGWPTRVPGM